MFRSIAILALFAFKLGAQDVLLPLESVAVSGSQVSRAVVLEIAELKLGSSVNKARIKEACQKLGESGVFETVSYRYAPGPKKGYAVTLELTDPQKLVDAAIDIPGADENAIWDWVSGQFPNFKHKAPLSNEGQRYLTGRIETRMREKLHGGHLVNRIEANTTKGGRPLLSFQPEVLPRIALMNFPGASRLPESELNKLMQEVLGGDGFLERHFKNLVELNLRRAYEEHGMYKVKFPSVQVQEQAPSAVLVTTTVVEGLQYTLADVDLLGEELPKEKMMAEAKFQLGKIANWTEIQQGIWRAETPVKRLGYMNAAALPERVLDDEKRTLSVKIPFRKGPLYHFGEVRFAGLSPELETKARTLWKMRTGDPYDLLYSNEFYGEFAQRADLSKSKFSAKSQSGTGDHVVNEILTFESVTK